MNGKMYNFRFSDCIEIKELLGIKADDELKLMEFIEEVPIDSIYYHMHSYFLRHFYIVGPYPNDFANWVVIQLRDRVLGEKLAAITPWGSKNLEDIREELIDIIDNHLSTVRTVPFAISAPPFFFMKSKIIEFDTGLEVADLKEFIEALKVVDASAIYNHIFESRLRVKKGRTDFSIWFDEVLGLKKLADEIENIDSYMYGLEGLREKILSLCLKALDDK